MEVLLSLSTLLKDIIKDIEDDSKKQEFVIEHIRNVEKNYFAELQFPQGMDWFNVSRPLTENDLRGKIIVLDFFTYCCINCLHLIPHLKAVEEKFSISDGLVVIGVHSAKFENEKKSSNIALALKKYNILHPVINDSNGFLWEKMKISCWPTIVIIGPGGQALFVLIGEQCRDELFLYIESTLKYFKNEISSHPFPVDISGNTAKSSILSFPGKIARFDNVFAVSDSGNNRILIIDSSGFIQLKIGGKSKGYKDGSFEEAQFNCPQGVVFRNKFEIYVADTENHLIRLIDLKTNAVKTIAGTGIQGTDFVGGKLGTSQEISSPWDLCFIPSNHVDIGTYLNKAGSEQAPVNISNLSLSSNSSIPPPPPCLPYLHGSSIALQPSQNPITLLESTQKKAEESMNKVLLIAMSGIHQIWAFFFEETTWWRGKKYEKNICVAIAGSGKEENRNNRYPMMASFAQPSGLAYNAKMKCVFIADSESSSVRKLALEDGSVSHVVGGNKNPADLFNFGDVDGKGYNAKLQHPLGLTYGEKDNILYICDTYNNKIKKVDMSTLECSVIHEENGLFNEPSGCVLDEAGEILYIADTNNNSITTYDVKSKALQKIVVKERELEDLTSSDNNNWEMETEISDKGGSIILIFLFGPEDIHGNWKVDTDCSNIESDAVKGEISSMPLELQFRILPNNNVNHIVTANIAFNFSYCEKDVCMFKKFVLKLSIKKSKEGKKINRIEFNKTIG